MTVTTALQTIRACIDRDLDAEPQSVIKVDELRTLRTDLVEYVLTDQLARDYARVFERVVEASRPAGAGEGDVGVWVSGYFGSGKSLFAKLAGHVLADTRVGEDSARDLFARHLKAGRPADDRLAELLHEARAYGLRAKLVAFDIMSQHTAAAERNVGLTFLRAFYRSLDLSQIIPVAQAELELRRAGRYDEFTRFYERRGDQVPWREDRDLTTCLPVLAECLAELLPQRYPTPDLALRAFEIGQGLADEQTSIEATIGAMLRWLGEQQAAAGGVERLIFVADEVGAWAGRDLDRIEQLRAFVQDLGRLGQGRIWLLVTSQEKLSDVIADQAISGVNAKMLQRLEARFKVNVHLDASEVSTVIADRVLAKKATARGPLEQLWHERHQVLLDIAAPPSLEMGSVYPKPELDAFVADYPFLPYQLPAAAGLFGSMRGVKVSSGARSMLKVAFDATRTLADNPIGAVVAWDQIFDSANSGNEFADEQYLGSLGLEHIRQADRDLPDAPITPSRVLKVLWLMQWNARVSRTPANLARLLVRHLASDDALTLETLVRETLEALEHLDYVRRDPATEQWRHLSQDEVTVEKMLRHIGADVREAEVRREALKLYEARLAGLLPGRVSMGQMGVAFQYRVELDRTTVKNEGQPVAVRVLLPGAKTERTEREVSDENAANLDAPTVTWIVGAARGLEERLRRALAIDRLPHDEQFQQSASPRAREQARRLAEDAGQLRADADKEVEGALTSGTLYYAGTTVPVGHGGTASARATIEEAIRDRLGTVFTGFAEADRKFRSENIERLFSLAPPDRAGLDHALGLFTPDGHVLGNHVLVEPVLRYLRSSNRTAGQDVQEAFAAPPYGWPGDLLRYIAAALFVDGRVAAADRTGRRTDDWRTPGAKQLFGTQAFKSTRLDVEEDALTPEEVSEARALLADLGRRTEDGTEVALKEATLTLCLDLSRQAVPLQRATSADFPLPERYATIPGLIRDIQDAGSRVKVVRALLARAAALRQADADLRTLAAFDERGGFAQLERTRQLMAAATEAGLGQDAAVAEACDQLAHLIAERRVLADWEGAFKQNRLRLLDAFRDAYAPLRQRVAREVEQARHAVLQMPELQALGLAQQEPLWTEFLGQGKPLQKLPEADLQGDGHLIAANRDFSIAFLRSIESSLDAVLPRARARVLELYARVQEESGKKARIVTWEPARAFAGKRFTTVAELEAAFAEQLAELKRAIAEGKEIQVL